jgi:hypothetical protein
MVLAAKTPPWSCARDSRKTRPYCTTDPRTAAAYVAMACYFVTRWKDSF